MIVVDTSVWIRAFRTARSAEAAHLKDLLDADAVSITIVTKLEIMMGVSQRNREQIRRTLSALPVYRPTAETWPTLERWTDEAALAGQRFGVADLLVGAIATEAGAEVWSLDRDFGRMAELKLVTLHAG